MKAIRIIANRLKSILEKFIGRPVRVPAKVLARFTESTNCAPYLVSCFERPTILYLSPRFPDITGYPCEQFQNEGPKLWFSVIHPGDVESVSDRIAKAHFQLTTNNSPPNKPLELEYRIRRKDGQAIWIRELKQIISFRDRKKDHILGCFRDISEEKNNQAIAVQDLLKKEKNIHGLLEVAADYQASSKSCKVIQISKREKQVLQLVASGSSSKQIASALEISENTVETHRRRLLEKFKVNNSTALIQEAHRLAMLPYHGFP